MSSSFVGRPGKEYEFQDDPKSPKMELVERLGTGASSEVWRVNVWEGGVKRGRQGVLKVYKKRLGEHRRAERQFETEASFNYSDSRFILPEQSGPIISDDGRHAILYPYVKCEQLFKYIRENISLTLDDKMGLVQHSAASISQLHNQGLLHNDIKPQNLLYVEGDSSTPIRLIDFQLACKENEVEDLFRGTSGRLGTDGYQAPEVLLLTVGAKGVSRKSDIWSLACTAYYILVGREVYDRRGFDDREEVVNWCKDNLDVPFITSKQMEEDGVPRGLARVLERMLIPRMSSRSNELLVFLNNLCKTKNRDCNVILGHDSSDLPRDEIRERIREEFPGWRLKNLRTQNRWIFLEIERRSGVDPNELEWGEVKGGFEVHVVDDIGVYVEPTPVETVRVTLNPNGKPKQYIMIGRGKSNRKYVMARHFDGQEFPNRKLLRLEWDGHRLRGSGRTFVTKEGSRLKGKRIENNDILHFDGLPTRITFEAS